MPLHFPIVVGGGQGSLHVMGQVRRTLLPTIGCTQRAKGTSKQFAGSDGEFGHGPGYSVVMVAVVVVVVIVTVVVVVDVVEVIVAVLVVVVDVVEVIVADVVVVVVAVGVVVVAVIVVMVVEDAVTVKVVVDVVHEPHSEGHRLNSTSLPSCFAVLHNPGE